MISHKPASAGAIQTMRLGRDVAADIKEFRLAESREGFDSFDQMGNWRIPGIDSQKRININIDPGKPAAEVSQT